MIKDYAAVECVGDDQEKWFVFVENELLEILIGDFRQVFLTYNFWTDHFPLCFLIFIVLQFKYKIETSVKPQITINPYRMLYGIPVQEKDWEVFCI